jgi:glycosyltransferase involved in cell wall biosynthesis
VFFPSVFTHHLVGLVPFLRSFAPQMQTKFLLFFPSTPIRRDPKTGKAIPKSDLTAQWFPALIGALRSLVESGQVVLGAETRAMQDALTGLCGLPFIYLPHPVLFPRLGEFATRTDHLIIGHYGTSRFEKGSDLFQSAAKIWLKRNPEANVRFVVQWTKDFDNETGRRIKKDDELETHPKFEFIDRYFEPDGGYLRQVAATDIMVLPYRDSYRYRLSRVVIEAMLAGLPVVVTQGTTLHEQAAEHGAAVGIEMDSVESLVEGINEAVANFGALRTQALEKARSSADHFSVANFRKALRICVNLI